jgi:sodium/proline symporter
VLTGMLGRLLLTSPGDAVTDVLGSGGEQVLPLLVDHLFGALIVGVYVAIVLSAIMSTVDSLLVVASSAVVRDGYQKLYHPELDDAALMGLARRVTFVLASLALMVALAVAWTTPDRTIFWFVIFGWTGIAATFCPTVILSLFWPGFTARGALAAMIAGFVAVPLFKFGVYRLPGIGEALAPLEELVPAFCVSFLVGFLASRARRDPPEVRARVEEELAWAAAREAPREIGIKKTRDSRPG